MNCSQSNSAIRRARFVVVVVSVWQLEMLCNLAASEFVLPIGSLSADSEVPPIEELMHQRRIYDVSAEAFLIRLAKISSQPVGVFFASPVICENGGRQYRIDYFVASPTAPRVWVSGTQVPFDSIIHNCTAIGYTDSAMESWITGSETSLECVGIPAYPGGVYPRVAGLVRFNSRSQDRHPIRLRHGNVLDSRGDGPKIICQLVNDRAIRWGGGVARKAANQYPEAEKEFSRLLSQIPREKRLGNVIFSNATDDIVIASLVAQEGFGPSEFPRIRYSALERCLQTVTERAKNIGASIHMPKIGTGAARGDWGTIEEMLDDAMVRTGLSVTIYDLPPKRAQLELF